MVKSKFYITDVFGTKRYSGNQLAVFINGNKISSIEMQAIAAEINFSEITFICSDTKNNNGYNIKIFTPRTEVDFAGHPTLGTAFIINKYFENENAKKVVLNLKAGQIPVEINNDVLWMKQLQPQFRQNHSIEIISKILTINPNDIMDNFPVAEVSTGLPFIIVPVKNLQILKKAKVDLKYYETFIQTSFAKAFYVFCAETYQKNNDLAARVFCPYYGITEDAATGSATGCLAAYLLKHKYYSKDEIHLKIDQGYEIERPSELLIRANKFENKFDIFIGGKVNEVAEGEWIIN